MNDQPGIIIVGHGSPRAEANEGFVAMVGRIAARLGDAEVLPAFFSIARPAITEQVAELASRGVRRIALMPYFLYTGQHVNHDIPAILAACREAFPAVTLDLLPTLENEPLLEDIVVQRLETALGRAGGDCPDFRAATRSVGTKMGLSPLGEEPAQTAPKGYPVPFFQLDGPAIERRSYEIIDRQIATWPGDAAARQILRRVIHATADVSLARTLRVHPAAVERGRAALAAAAPLICDVRMLQAGLTKVRSETLCAIDREEVVRLATARGCTRAAAAMELLAPRLEGAIVAVGNAPTALWKLLEIVRGGGPRPALVVGLPVGLVGAEQSKQALMESDLCYISNVGPRGGSPVAAAAVNALAVEVR